MSGLITKGMKFGAAVAKEQAMLALVASGARPCTACGVEKPLTSQFFAERKRSVTGFDGKCRACVAEATREWRTRNTEKAKAYSTEYQRTSQVAKAVKLRSQKKCRDEKMQDQSYVEAQRKARAERHAADRERSLELHRMWVENNRGRKNAINAARRAAMLQATPTWADFDEISKVYMECARISKETGVPHHVDHIIPLKGKSVCGLHVAANLRIITAKENLKKSNKF